ncbi:hypothetical protein HDU81_000625 [Chytriomyces hyalinus]|nr:hypothetical protein HDU81_000625 [Chytriomyces hyalinus]
MEDPNTVQTRPEQLRRDSLCEMVMDAVLQKTDQPISVVGNYDADQGLELHFYRDVFDALTARHCKNMTPFVRDSLVNELSNARNADNVNAARLTHYLGLGFDKKGGESRRTFAAKITKEIVASYDGQDNLLMPGVDAHDAFIAPLHDMFVDFKQL